MQRIFALFTLLAIAWLGGFVWFVTALPTGAGGQPAKIDGIVVLTGGGGERIPTGMTLIDQGVGERLLISGVNPKISRDQIAALWPGAPDDFDCCVDLGKRAESTKGNAEEVRDWAQKHKFNNILLVTSDYHMPRAMLEMRDAFPNAKFTPHPVASVYLDAEGRPVSKEAWRLLVTEYTKFLAVRVKTLLPSA